MIGSLSVGMAVAIAALAFLNALLFRPFPAVTDQERLVRVAVSRDCGRPDCWIRMSSAADYESLRAELTGLEGLAAYTLGELAVTIPEAHVMRGALTSANYFNVLGVRPAVGRTFSAADEGTRAPVAVIAHRLWTREFGADPSVIGRSLRVADEFVQIVGVAPESFVGVDLKPARGDRGPDLWLPLWLADRVLPLTRAERRRQERDIYFVGRLRHGADAAGVQAAANVVALRLVAARRGESAAALATVHRVWMGNPEHRPLAVLVVLPIPIVVLAIACVNAANLLLAHGSQRQREIAIRLAIGGARGRIVTQLLIESAVLASLAAGVALLLAWGALQRADTPLGMPIPIDGTVLALTILTAGVTTAAFGLVPAIRVSAQQPSSALGTGAARSDAVPGQSRLRRALLVAQVALSLGLLATAGQLVATVRYQAVSSGTPADRLLIARFDLRPLNVPSGETETFYGRLVNGARLLPGVEGAALARHTSVWTFGQGAAPGSILVWHPADPPADGRVTIGGFAGGDLFEALGLRVVAGRVFTEADRGGRPRVAVVNQTFADAMNGAALGSLLRVAPRDQGFDASLEVQVIGVVEPTVEPRYAPGDRPAQKVYLPAAIEPEPALALYVRTRDDATALAQPIRDLVTEIAPRVPIQELGSLEQFNERSFAPQLWLARAAAFLGVIGVLLATAGLYGVSSYVVNMRRREVAIRMAIGAAPRSILTMMLGQSMAVALVGLLVGAAAALGASRWIQSEYHGIHGIDGLAFGGAVMLFLGAMLLASAIPAVRASRVDPIESLKEV